MFRPRDSHDLRVLATDLQVSPESRVRMIQDPHSNSVALVQPLAAATELRIVCTFAIEHAQSDVLELRLSPSAEFFPYSAQGVEAGDRPIEETMAAYFPRAVYCTAAEFDTNTCGLVAAESCGGQPAALGDPGAPLHPQARDAYRRRLVGIGDDIEQGRAMAEPRRTNE